MKGARAAVIAAADRIDPSLGAFITVDVDGAIHAAGRNRPGRLEGVIIAVKDLIDVADMRTTYGSPAYADHVPSSTAPAIEALTREGAIVLGKTNLNEFAFGVTGYNPHYGPILVPGDVKRTAGGSSGGSAAAVAAGVCRLAVGTDTSGSVRIPAACCGVWGFKCRGGGDLTGIHPLAPRYDSLGYLAAGPDELQQVLGIASLPDVSTLRIGEVGSGLEVPDMPEDHWTIFRHEAHAVHDKQLARDPGSFGADIRSKLALEVHELRPALEAERTWRSRFARAVANHNAVLLPVMDGPAPLLADAISDYEFGRSTITDRLLRHTAVANALGWPALAFPTSDGPMQVLGPPGSEPVLIAAAKERSQRN